MYLDQSEHFLMAKRALTSQDCKVSFHPAEGSLGCLARSSEGEARVPKAENQQTLDVSRVLLGKGNGRHILPAAEKEIFAGDCLPSHA